MIGIACVLLYLAIVKKFEPLLLLPIAFGMLLTNLPIAEMYHTELFCRRTCRLDELPGDSRFAGLFVSRGKAWHLSAAYFPWRRRDDRFWTVDCKPKSLLLGAAAQLGIFIALILALLVGFDPNVAASIEYYRRCGRTDGNLCYVKAGA